MLLGPRLDVLRAAWQGASNREVGARCGGRDGPLCQGIRNKPIPVTAQVSAKDGLAFTDSGKTARLRPLRTDRLSWDPESRPGRESQKRKWKMMVATSWPHG